MKNREIFNAYCREISINITAFLALILTGLIICFEFNRYLPLVLLPLFAPLWLELVAICKSLHRFRLQAESREQDTASFRQNRVSAPP